MALRGGPTRLFMPQKTASPSALSNLSTLEQRQQVQICECAPNADWWSSAPQSVLKQACRSTAVDQAVVVGPFDGPIRFMP